jgi:transcriptional regulator with XRE-family HTH domain
MNRIKILREEKKMTQQELADKISGAKSTIAMYEKGDRKPSMDVLIKLSKIFDCSIDYLLR